MTHKSLKKEIGDAQVNQLVNRIISNGGLTKYSGCQEDLYEIPSSCPPLRESGKMNIIFIHSIEICFEFEIHIFHEGVSVGCMIIIPSCEVTVDVILVRYFAGLTNGQIGIYLNINSSRYVGR